MGFVSALLLAIAMTVVQIGAIYNSGITYKNVNQASSSIIGELRRSINSSVPFDITTDVSGNGPHYVSKTWGGRLCTGQYSYIWNYGASIVNLDASRSVYSGSKPGKGKKDKTSEAADEIHFIKLIDSNSSYCSNPNSKVDKTDAVELLKAGQSDLAIHDFKISTNDSANDDSTNQRLYSIEFILGTNDQNSLNISKTACLLPDDVDSDSTYCSVGQFNLVVRAGNANASE